MKPIKITPQNIEQITEAITSAEGKATARKITAQGIIDACDAVTKRLCITKAAMNGTRIACDLHAQHFPNAYKFTPESTQFVAEYKRGEWRLLSVERDSCHDRSTYNTVVTLTDKGRDAIIERMSAMSI